MQAILIKYNGTHIHHTGVHTHTHIHTKITRRGKTKFSGGWEERRIMRRKIKKYILYVCVFKIEKEKESL